MSFSLEHFVSFHHVSLSHFPSFSTFILISTPISYVHNNHVLNCLLVGRQLLYLANHFPLIDVKEYPRERWWSLGLWASTLFSLSPLKVNITIIVFNFCLPRNNAFDLHNTLIDKASTISWNFLENRRKRWKETIIEIPLPALNFSMKFEVDEVTRDYLLVILEIFFLIE